MISQRAVYGFGLDQFLKMMKDMHEVMQDAKGEEPTARRPVAARFILADGTDLVPQPGQEKKPDEPTNGVERDGQMYVDADAE